jgi:Flp pilus assembly protein TadG
MATIELALLTPLVLVVLSFLVLAGRLGTTSADVVAASRDAARAASLAQTFDEAVDEAARTARASLSDQHVTCANLTVLGGDPARFVPGGEVTISVSCDVQLSDVVIPGVPGSRTVSSVSTEIIDRYRSVG